MLQFLSKMFLLADAVNEDNNALTPIYTALDIILPVALGLILLAGVIYSVVLGTQYSKAITPEERDTARKKLINAVIGFVIVIILVALLWVLKDPLMRAMNNTQTGAFLQLL